MKKYRVVWHLKSLKSWQSHGACIFFSSLIHEHFGNAYNQVIAVRSTPGFRRKYDVYLVEVK